MGHFISSARQNSPTEVQEPHKQQELPFPSPQSRLRICGSCSPEHRRLWSSSGYQRRVFVQASEGLDSAQYTNHREPPKLKPSKLYTGLYPSHLNPAHHMDKRIRTTDHATNRDFSINLISPLHSSWKAFDKSLVFVIL